MLVIQIASWCPKHKAEKNGISEKGGTEKRSSEVGAGKDMMTQLYEIFVCACMLLSVWSTKPSLVDGPCYPGRLNAKMVIKVEQSHCQPNPDWHQEEGNLNVFTWGSSVAQRFSQ